MSLLNSTLTDVAIAVALFTLMVATLMGIGYVFLKEVFNFTKDDEVDIKIKHVPSGTVVEDTMNLNDHKTRYQKQPDGKWIMIHPQKCDWLPYSIRDNEVGKRYKPV